jgi:hypothetical protein
MQLGFSDDLEQPAPVGLHHDQVAAGFGFEFVEHRLAA